MRYTQNTIKRDTKRMEQLAEQFIELGSIDDAMECYQLATALRETIPNTAGTYCPPYMVAHCIKRGYNPEQFAAHWAGE